MYNEFHDIGSEIAGEAAAALAAATLAGASPTTDYLTPAQQLYSFATGPAMGSYANTNSLGIQIHSALYPSTVGSASHHCHYVLFLIGRHSPLNLHTSLRLSSNPWINNYSIACLLARLYWVFGQQFEHHGWPEYSTTRRSSLDWNLT